jgi:hypothetical protein
MKLSLEEWLLTDAALQHPNKYVHTIANEYKRGNAIARLTLLARFPLAATHCRMAYQRYAESP